MNKIAQICVTLTAWVACCAAPAGLSAQAPCAPDLEVEQAATLDSLQVLYNAGIASVRSGWIIGGMARPMSSADEDRRPLIASEAHGRTQPLPSAFPVEMPVPAALGPDRWGVVWATAEPIGDQSDRRAHMFTRLRFSERVDGAWGPPTDLLNRNWIFWRKRTIEHVPGVGTFVMVPALDSTGQPVLSFGALPEPLQTISIDSDPEASAISGSFHLDPAGRVRVVAEVIGSDGGRRLVLLQSSDSGRSWTEPEVLVELNATLAEIRVHGDRAGNVHVIWRTTRRRTLHHLHRTPGAPEWRTHLVDNPDGLLLTWLSGLDQCGRLTLVTWTPVPESSLSLAVARWSDDGWTNFSSLSDGPDGYSPFDGIGHDGRWWIGWTGSGGGSGSLSTEVFLGTP